jgi:hypothetical protein
MLDPRTPYSKTTIVNTVSGQSGNGEGNPKRGFNTTMSQIQEEKVDYSINNSNYTINMGS